MTPKEAKGCLRRIAVLVGVVILVVFHRTGRFHPAFWVGRISLVSGGLAESPYRLERLLGRYGRGIVKLTSRVLGSFGVPADEFVSGVLCTLSA